jgi:hypothetical protein
MWLKPHKIKIVKLQPSLFLPSCQRHLYRKIVGLQPSLFLPSCQRHLYRKIVGAKIEKV